MGAIKSLPLCLESKDPPSFLNHFIVWWTHKQKQCTAGLNKPLKPKLPKSQKMHQWTSTQLGGPFWSQELWDLTLSQSTVFFFFFVDLDLSNTKDQDRGETRKRVICCPPSWSECHLLGFSAATFTTISLSSSPLCYSTYTQLSTYKHLFLLYRLGSAHEEHSALFLSLSDLCIKFYILVHSFSCRLLDLIFYNFIFYFLCESYFHLSIDGFLSFTSSSLYIGKTYETIHSSNCGNRDLTLKGH